MVWVRVGEAVAWTPRFVRVVLLMVLVLFVHMHDLRFFRGHGVSSIEDALLSLLHTSSRVKQ